MSRSDTPLHPSDAPTVPADPDATQVAPGDDAAAMPTDWLPDCPGYGILRQLGAGAMGQVFLARDDTLERLVAIKTIRPDFAAIPGFSRRFLREARAMARLHHPHVLSVHAAGSTRDEIPYLVMEFAEQGSLGDRFGTAIAEADVRRWMIGAARGLHALHESGLVHRDIKPANIMLDGSGTAKIGDLGLVHHLERSGVDVSNSFQGLVGTPFYMSPEQIRQESLDPRSDIFALGCTAFALLAGSVPFEGATLVDVGHRILHEPTPDITRLRSDLPHDWPAILAACLAKDPDQRFADADQLARALNGERVGPLLTASSTASRSRPATRRFGWWPLALAAAVLVAGGGTWWVQHSAGENSAAQTGSPERPEPWSAPLGEPVAPAAADPSRPVSPPSRPPAAVETTPLRPAPPAETVARQPIDPTVSPSWASAHGEDESGWYADLTVGPATQRLRWIPPGSFVMGSPAAETGRDTDEVQIPITLSQGFWLADTECSQAFWQAVVGRPSPSHFTGPQLPVEDVDWSQVQDFLRLLSPQCTPDGVDLPTEAEWEYACRAGTTTAYHWGDDPDQGHGYANLAPELVGWTTNGPNPPNKALWPADWNEDLGTAWTQVTEPDGFRETTAPVASFAPNPWGLYDMHGNLWEWTHSDWGAPRPTAGTIDPAPTEGSKMVRRGGSWFFLPRHARSAERDDQKQNKAFEVTGFRFLVRSTGP